MKKSILVACSVVALTGMTAAAQQPQPQTPPTQQTPPAPPDPSQRPPDPNRPMPDAPRPMADVASSTTVTGCLKTWDSRTMAPATGAGSGAGSAAAGASSPSPSEFVLTNVEGAPAGGSGKGSFLLKTSDASVSFSQHLNHKVSLTGKISDAAKDMGASTPPTADKPSTDRDASASGRGDAKLPVLTVTALKMVSPTCGS